jgi:hypothetical protein
MKKLIFLIVLAVCASACTKKTIVLKAPPGQMKKATGSQSAKSFAPGQQKKAANTQSAKSFAPGQQKKAATGKTSSVKKTGSASGKKKN